MAITVVASVFGTSAGGTTGITLVYAGAQENDIAVTWGGFAGGTATAPGVTSPSGYSSVWQQDTAALDTKLEWKRLGATPDPSVLLAASGDAADAIGYAAYVLRGVTTAADPFDAVFKSSVATGVPQAPSIVTATNGAVILAFGANDVNDGSIGTVTNFGANMGGSSNDTDDFSVGAAASVIATAGSITPTAWTTWTAGAYNAIAVALKPATTPTVTSSVISEITQTTATGGGNVTADGGSPILERGVAWGTSASPTTVGSHANTPGTTGFYQTSITGLNAGTSYFAAAYAINALGSVYGSDQAFSTDAPPPAVQDPFQSYMGAFSVVPKSIRPLIFK